MTINEAIHIMNLDRFQPPPDSVCERHMQKEREDDQKLNFTPSAAGRTAMLLQVNQLLSACEQFRRSEDWIHLANAANQLRCVAMEIQMNSLVMLGIK